MKLDCVLEVIIFILDILVKKNIDSKKGSEKKKVYINIYIIALIRSNLYPQEET